MLKMKRFSVLLKVLTVLAMVLMVFAMWFTPATTASAADPTETMNIFGSTGVKASDSSSISWTGEHFTFTNNKASSSTAIRTSDNDHYRVYTKSTCTLSANNGELISKVVITSTGSGYVSGCSPTSGTKTTNGTTITITFTEAVTEVAINSTAQWRLKKIVVTYTEASNDCAHTSVSTVYDSATEEHYQQCIDCKTEIEGTREACAFGEATPNSIGGGKHTLTQVCDTCQGEKVTTKACSEFTEGDWETADGVHTRTLTCNLCGGKQTESGECQISEGEWTREGNQHSKTGTCTVCGDSTMVTEACTLSYENISNDNGTHNTISTCSVCNQSATEENVACTFEESWNVGDTVLTYTCKYCEYSYTEEATLYTVTYSVPEGVEAPAAAVVAEGYTTKLPTAANSGDYTFVGWLDDTYEQSTTAPNFLKAGADYEVTEPITLHAVYSFAEDETEEGWKLVTAANQLAVGKQIVIAASGYDYALGSNQAKNNRTAVEITKSGNTITWTTAVQVITLEAGTSDGTWAFYVKDGTGTNAVNGGYLYAAGGTGENNYLRTSTSLDLTASWTISISGNNATIKTADSNVARHTIRFNDSSKLFSCYATGQQAVSIYVKTGGAIIYYTTSFGGEHEHAGTIVEREEPTCTGTGIERTKCECGHIIEEVELEALGHEYDEETNLCIRCSEQDPETIDYSGYYYISFTHSETVYYVDNSELDSNRYYARTEAPAVDSVTTKYVFRLEKTATGIYSLYELDGDLYQDEITVEKVEGVYRFYAKTEDGDCQLLLNGSSTTKYIKFYKASNATQSNYAQDVTLTPVDLSANMNGASLTLGEDIAVNYYVTMSEAFAENAVMYFTVNGETKDVQGEVVDGRYMFTLNLPPQYMAYEIVAELKYNEVVLDSYSYSIKTYAQNKLNAGESSDELKQLLSDMLYYGAAAYNYCYEPTGENPVTEGVENLFEASNAAPSEADKMTLETNGEAGSYPAWFGGANVWFDGVNQLMVNVKLADGATLDKVSLTIDGAAVEVTDTTVKTEGIQAVDFAKNFVLVLSYDGVVMQTLTYSVNAYAFAMQNSETAPQAMKDLALALYRYGVAAVAYKA